MTAERIGFIGVGLMGHGMAKNLVEKGHPLTVMAHRNRRPGRGPAVARRGEAATPRAVAEASDIVHLCVSGSPQVEAVRNAYAAMAAAGEGERYLPMLADFVAAQNGLDR